MCLSSFILINITSNGKIINLEIIVCFRFFENTFNKKVPLTGISGISMTVLIAGIVGITQANS